MKFNKNILFNSSVVVILFFLTAFSAGAQSNAEAFTKALRFADSVYNLKEYENARAAYQYADRFQPGSALIQRRIAEIDVKLAELSEIDRQYSIVISEARQALNASDLLKAKEHLEHAHLLKPNESWPVEKLAEINEIFFQRFELQKIFDAHVVKGDNFFSEEKYKESISEYESALKLIPDHVEVKNKLASVKNRIKEIENNYKAQVALGDKLYLENNLEASKEAFLAALAIKPSELYPKQKIAQIDHIIADEAAMAATLDAIIKAADEAFDNRNYSLASKKYKEALDVLSTHTYSRERLKEIERIIGENEAKRLAYNGVIEKADAHFDQQRYDEAKTEYENALELLSDEPYPKQKIAEIDQILSRQLADRENLERMIAEADALFDASQWLPAREKYSEVLQINLGNTYATQRIKTIDATLTQIEKDYTSLISRSDNYFKTNKYPEALDTYTQASLLKPDETYPKGRIAEINAILNDKTAQQQQYDALIAEADAVFSNKNWEMSIEKYTAALEVKPAEVYPKQQLAKANKELQTFLASEKRYNDEILRADVLFNDQRWSDAIIAYEAALKIKPEENYPVEQISVARVKLGDIAALEENYKAAINEGNVKFKEKNWREAITKYQEALALKPEENYPKVQIDKANIELEKVAEADAAYHTALQHADSLFTQASWGESVIAYQAVNRIRPNESYVLQQIEKAEAYMADQARLEREYKSTVTVGDKFFHSKRWSEAIAEYTKASGLKPDEQYPKDQIIAATTQLQEIEAVDISYNNAVIAADQYFTEKKYEEAKASYTAALEIKPAEKHPSERIIAIDEILANLAQYNELIVQADGLYDQQNWNEALTLYAQAVKVQPEETYPQERIAAITNILSEQADLQSRYALLISQADVAFKAKNWNGAVAAYQNALTLKPEEAYPRDQIEKANKELEIIAATDAAYLSAIQSADSLFALAQWESSITAYQSAIKIKADHAYPRQQIEKANTEIQALSDRETAFNNKIAEGDTFFTAKDWERAKSSYQEALQLKPEEAYPPSQIALIDEQLRLEQEKRAAEQALEENYLNIIAQADAVFSNMQWNDAVTLYQSALNLKQEEKYPQQQIDVAYKELEKIAVNRKLYEEHIARGDQLFQQSDWLGARTSYTQALNLFSEEAYPSQQIAAIDATLEEIARIQKQYDDAIADADAAFFIKNYEDARRYYEDALRLKSDESYPAQRLTEIENIVDAEKAAENARLYRENVTEANTLIAEKKLEEAIIKLNKALEYRPNDDFATKKIAELQKTIDDAAFALSEYNRLIQEADKFFEDQKYKEAIASYRAAMRFQPNEIYPRKKVAEAERNLEYTPARRRQLAQESAQRGQDALNSKSYEAAMRAFANAYYWYPEDGDTYKAKLDVIISTLESRESKDLLEQPMNIVANKRATLEMDFKPSELKGTTYALIKVSGDYDNNVNMFVRWGRFSNEYNATVITLVYGLDGMYYCAEIKGAANGLTWISFIPENADLIIEEVKLVSQ